jgi:hypothetical protein
MAVRFEPRHERALFVDRPLADRDMPQGDPQMPLDR